MLAASMGFLWLLSLGVVSGYTAWGRLGAFFAAGMILRHNIYRLPSSAPAALACLAGSIWAVCTSNYLIYFNLGPLALGYVLLWLADRLPVRVGARNDVSYGIYIYGAPVQQLAVSVGLAAVMGPVWFALASAVVVSSLAWASWLLVERPVLSLRRLMPAKRERLHLNPPVGSALTRATAIPARRQAR